MCLGSFWVFSCIWRGVFNYIVVIYFLIGICVVVFVVEVILSGMCFSNVYYTFIDM